MNIWDQYRESRTEKVDLAEIGLDGFVMKVRDPGSLTPTEADALQKLTNVRLEEEQEFNNRIDALQKEAAALVAVDEDDEDSKVDEADQARADELVALANEMVDSQVVDLLPHIGNLIEEWNITDPVTGEVLPLPKDDPEGISVLPSEVSRWINMYIIEMYNRSGEPPKVTLPS